MKTGCFECLIGGGVASSKYLRASLQSEISANNPTMRIYFAEPEMSSDNACGVAMIARQLYHN